MELKQIAKDILENNWFAGVRSLQPDENYVVGDICRESYEWDIENDCSTYDSHGEDGMKADGTCASFIDTQYFETDDWETELAERIQSVIDFNSMYEGTQVIIVGDSTNTNGLFDENEVRIIDAKVLAIVE